jgi:chloramphenicol-sensitive protein RarD
MVTAHAKGLFAAFFCFFFWGIIPLYWKQFVDPNPLELLCHRIVWGFVFLLCYLLIRGRGAAILDTLRDRRVLRLLIAPALVIGLNWFIFAYAVVTRHIVEASLGYFINPLFNILLGVFFLGEKLKTRHWLAISLATIGVLFFLPQGNLTLWISLSLALTFALYGLLRKQILIVAELGLFIELLMMLGPALFLIGLEMKHGNFHFLQQSFSMQLLFISTGLITIVPLTIFVNAAKRIHLSELGMVQYITPSLQLIMGVLVYQEPFQKNHKIAFSLIWMAIIIYLFKDIKKLFGKRNE